MRTCFQPMGQNRYWTLYILRVLCVLLLLTFSQTELGRILVFTASTTIKWMDLTFGFHLYSSDAINQNCSLNVHKSPSTFTFLHVDLNQGDLKHQSSVLPWQPKLPLQVILHFLPPCGHSQLNYQYWKITIKLSRLASSNAVMPTEWRRIYIVPFA